MKDLVITPRRPPLLPAQPRLRELSLAAMNLLINALEYSTKVMPDSLPSLGFLRDLVRQSTARFTRLHVQTGLEEALDKCDERG